MDNLDMFSSPFGVMFFDDSAGALANLRRAARDGADLRFVAWRSAAENPCMTSAERAAAPLPKLPARRADAAGGSSPLLTGTGSAPSWRRAAGPGIGIRPIDVACNLPEKELVGYLTRLGPVGLVLREMDERTSVRLIPRRV